MVFPNIPTECWQEDNGDSSSVPSLFAVKEWVENLPPTNQSEVVNRSVIKKCPLNEIKIIFIVFLFADEDLTVADPLPK